MKNKKILMIDDEIFHREVAKFSFEDSGYDFIEAGDGEEGIKKAIEENPDLIIVDLIMPKKDGFEVCRALRDKPETAGLPIIMMSGFDAQNISGRGKAFGADMVLKKPVLPEDLVKKAKEKLYQ